MPQPADKKRSQGREINFLAARKFAYTLSVLLIVVSVVSLATRGLNFGIDFTGGVLIEVAYPQPAELDQIRTSLTDAGYEGAQVMSFGTDRDVLMRLPPEAEGVELATVRDDVLDLLRAAEPAVELRSVEFVSPQVGSELAEQGSLALLFALLMILAYVSFRFQWKFSLGAVLALAHDVIITLGVFSVLQISFNLAVLAALLATIGYSLNDSIVVFDRIRENFLTVRREAAERIVNLSINQILSRTVITSVTTLLVLLALLFVGGEALYGFSVALIVGVLVGTYSSIYVASELTLALKISTRDLLPPERDEDEALKNIP